MRSGKFLETQDGIKIDYNWYPAENPKGYLLLIHMMPTTKESWDGFAKEIQKNYSSIAIDLRGHGDSQFGPGGFAKFSDADHQKSILDLEAAVRFLKKQGASPEKIAIIGASIGANLALRYLEKHPEIKTAILLSAGLNYRGIETKPIVKKLSGGQKILFFASKDDAKNASDNEGLADLVPAGAVKELVIFERGGHGTDFLNQAKKKIIEFVNRYL